MAFQGAHGLAREEIHTENLVTSWISQSLFRVLRYELKKLPCKKHLYSTRYLITWHEILKFSPLLQKEKRRGREGRERGRGEKEVEERKGRKRREKTADYYILFLDIHLHLSIMKQVDHHSKNSMSLSKLFILLGSVDCLEIWQFFFSSTYLEE